MATIAAGYSRRDYVIAVMLMVLSAIAVGLLPSLSKLVLNDGSNPQTFLIIRSAVGVAAFGAALLATGGTFRIPVHFVAMVAVAGVSAALMNYAFVRSIINIDIGLAILVMFSHPFLVAMYYHWTREDPLTALRALWSILAFIGLGVALAVDYSHMSLTGLAYAAASALFCTVMVVSLVGASKAIGGIAACFYLSIAGVFLFSVSALATDSIVWPRSHFGWHCAVAAGLAFAAAFIAFLYAAKLIGGSRATLLSFTEPIMAIFVAAVLFGERLSMVQWGGVALVAAGLLLLEAAPGRRTVNDTSEEPDRARN